MTVPPASELLETALEAAEAAASVHSSFVGRVRVEDARLKGISDFVSQVDLEAQRAALRVIRDRFPDHAVLSEEDDAPVGRSRPSDRASGSGSEPDRAAAVIDSAAPLWIVDPLDGTTNFLHGHPMFAASVGVTVGGESRAGAVVAAATNERWSAARGEGAFRNGRRIQVSNVDELRFALVGTGFPFKLRNELRGYLREFESVLPACAGIRRGGSASLDLCYLAQGSFDAFWEARLEPWDLAAGVVILTEAGGVVRRKDGGRLDVLSPGSVLAANSAELLQDLSRQLAAVPPPEQTKTPAG